MKRYLMTLSLLLVGVAICLAPVTANANPKAQLASGGFYIWLSEPGEATCVGGSPTGSFPPCTPGTKEIIWRNYVGLFSFGGVTGDAAPFFSGAWLSPGNCNLDENLAGHCWGTFEGNVLDGKWEGTWNGKLDFIHFGGDLRFVGHGSGGSLGGLHMTIEATGEGTGDPYAAMPFTARVFKIDQ